MLDVEEVGLDVEQELVFEVANTALGILEEVVGLRAG
jgi:hypothetical protein